jgi:hypothetical protein
MRKRSMALAVVAASILLTPQALTPQAQAFGTIRSLGQNAEHERITRTGLATFGFARIPSASWPARTARSGRWARPTIRRGA